MSIGGVIMADEGKIKELKVQLFDIIREQGLFQQRIAQLEETKRNLLDELQKLEQEKKEEGD